MEKANRFCAVLLVIVLALLAVCIWQAPSGTFSVANCFCYYFMAIVLILFPMSLNTEGKGERNLLISFLMAFISIEIGIFFSVEFWCLPILAAVLPTLYFMRYSWIHAHKLNTVAFANNLFYLLLLSYVFCLLVKVIIEPTWLHFLG